VTAGPARRRTSNGRAPEIAAFARAWRPVHERLDAALPPVADPEAMIAATAAVLADDAWIDTLIEAATAGLRHDPFFALPFRPVVNEVRAGLVILDRPDISLTLDIVHAARLAQKKNRPRPGSVGFPGEISVIRFVKAGGAVLSLWEAPSIGLDFSAAGAGTCRKVGRRAVADGETLTIDGRHQSFVIEAARTNIVLANATIRTEAPVSAEYDADNGAYLGCSAADDRDSRLQMVATLARLLDADAAFPVIAGLLDHPSFFVRWHAMRELLGVDAEAALPYLRLLATHDPHSDVRATARATLDLVAAPRRRAA
jgi:hypothetical protein